MFTLFARNATPKSASGQNAIPRSWGPNGVRVTNVEPLWYVRKGVPISIEKSTSVFLLNVSRSSSRPSRHASVAVIYISIRAFASKSSIPAIVRAPVNPRSNVIPPAVGIFWFPFLCRSIPTIFFSNNFFEMYGAEMYTIRKDIEDRKISGVYSSIVN